MALAPGTRLGPYEIVAAIGADRDTMMLGLGGRDRSGEMAHEHRALIDALVAGDHDAAERMTRTQIEESRKMVLTALVAGDGRGVSVA